jgi:tetratricopeptide (TPR) repeat protein
MKLALRAIALLILFSGVSSLQACGKEGEATQQTADSCASAQENADATIEVCTRMLKSDLNAWSRRSAAALSLRGWAWKAKGNLERATEDFSEAIRLDPTFAPPFEARGNLYRDSNKCAQAIPDYNEAIRLQPQRIQNYMSRALCQIAQSQFQNAVSDLDQVVSLDSSNVSGFAANALTVKARVNVQQAHLKEAVESLDRAISLAPKRAALYVTRGAVFERIAMADRAIADLDKAIELDQSNTNGLAATAWTMKARMHLAAGDFDRAISDASESIRLEPNNAAHYLARARIWNTKGNFDRALEDHNRAIETNAKDGTAYISRGDLYQSRNDYVHAIQDYTQAIAREPDSLAAYGNRALVYFFQKEFAKAADDFKRVAEGQANAYTALLLFVSRSRINQTKEAKTELAKSAATLSQGEWPLAIIDLYLGRKSPQAVEAAAAKPEERCEVHFYIGEWHLLNGAQPQAAKRLQTAIETCSKDSMEYFGAVAELAKPKQVN